MGLCLAGKDGTVREGEICPPLLGSAPGLPCLGQLISPLTKRRRTLGLQQTGVCRVSHLSLASWGTHFTQSIRKHQTERRDFWMLWSTVICLGTLGLRGPQIAQALTTGLPSSSPRL